MNAAPKLQRVTGGMEGRRWHYLHAGGVLCGQRTYAGFHPLGERRADSKVQTGCAKCLAIAAAAQLTEGTDNA